MADRTASVQAWESLFRAQVTVMRALNENFPSALSLNEYDVLFNLSLLPGHRARMRDLNPLLLITQPSISRLVDRLVAQNLVTKDSDPDDGRGTIVTLTPAGMDLYRRVAVVHARHIHSRMDVLTDEELATLTAITTKLRRGAN